MFVYGSLVVSGMVLPSYDNGFQPRLAILGMPWYVGIFILVLSFGLSDGFQNLGWRWSQGSFQSPTKPLTSFGGIHGKD